VSKNLTINNTRPVMDCFSLFDEQFSISTFSDALEVTSNRASDIIDSAKSAVHKAFAGADGEEKYNYVVDMADDIKEAIEAGEIKLVTNADGEVFAQIRNANGRFGNKLPIKKELVEEGISVEELQLALQMDLIKEQLGRMIESLKDIEGRVTEVVQGLHNDRIGLFYGGLSLFAEARSIQDESLRKMVTAQALHAVSSANSQMIQEIRTSIEFLGTEQYRKFKNKSDKIDEHLGIIHQCYDVVYRASFLKAAIYHENNEIASMLTAIDEYGRFVEKLIVPYAGMLSELDKNSMLVEQSTWGYIAGTLTGCRELKQRIAETNVFYLMEEGEEHGR